MGGSPAPIPEVVQEPYKLAPYVVPRRKLGLKKKPVVEPAVVELTVSAPLELAEPISYALEVDTLSEAGRSVERVLSEWKNSGPWYTKKRNDTNGESACWR
jgi:hypothetical protein